MEINITVPKRPKEELDDRQRMIDHIEGEVGTLEVEWCTMSTESLEKLYDYICG